MRALLIAAIVALSGTAALAQADDPGQMRQQLTSLSTEIEQLDAKLTDIGKKRTDLQATVEVFGKTVEQNKAAAQHVRDLDAQLATRKQQLETEQHAAAELCGRKVSEAEYKALVAQCQTATTAYQQHTEALKREYEEVVAAHAKHEADTRKLEAERKQLEQQREGVQQTQSSLHTERERLVKQFNDTRDHLAALQPKAN